MTTRGSEPLSGSDLRSRRKQALVAAAVVGVLGVALIAALVSSYVRNAPLRGDGLVTTQAIVEDFDRNRRRSDEVQVTYDVPGHGRLQADIPVRRSFTAGETVDVSYAPTEPGLVRTAADWAPSYTSPPLLVMAGASVVLVVICLVGAARPASLPSREGRVTPRNGPLGISVARWVFLGGAAVLLLVFAVGRWLGAVL